MDASPPRLRGAVLEVKKEALRSYADSHRQSEEWSLAAEEQPARPPLREMVQYQLQGYAWTPTMLVPGNPLSSGSNRRSAPVASSPSVLSKSTRESSAGTPHHSQAVRVANEGLAPLAIH
jgi:hypothetical protein